VTIRDSGATLAIGSSTLNVTGLSTTSSAINITAGHITIAGGKIISDAGGLALASVRGAKVVAVRRLRSGV
jgi:hypothetical protein